MKAMWQTNYQLETQFTKEVEVHKRTIIFNTIAKTKMVDTKRKLWESKFAIQTIDQHITKVKVKVKFDDEFKCCIINLDKDSCFTFEEVLILHNSIWHLKHKVLTINLAHTTKHAFITLCWMKKWCDFQRFYSLKFFFFDLNNMNKFGF
jgi:hypothetical protein